MIMVLSGHGLVNEFWPVPIKAPDVSLCWKLRVAKARNGQHTLSGALTQGSYSSKSRVSCPFSQRLTGSDAAGARLRPRRATSPSPIQKGDFGKSSPYASGADLKHQDSPVAGEKRPAIGRLRSRRVRSHESRLSCSEAGPPILR